MKRLALLGFAVVVAGLFLGAMVPASVTASSPRVVPGAPAGVATPVSHHLSMTPAPAAPVAAHSANPSAGCVRPTPTGTPNWNTANFFADALVTFYVPGSPSLTGSNFQAAPCNNVIPTYTNGFWM
ncbi:MAG TPA: hypothetical protein VEY07_07155, partial [Thermoplasmata archaeon]|nr:hypothetical protein [Thermoplasmata archaeon]